MNNYQRKNLRCAFDAVSTLAENAGDAMKSKECGAALLPPLLQKWEQGGDSQADLYQLLECVTSVVIGLGLGCQAGEMSYTFIPSHTMSLSFSAVLNL